jgi:5-bromo-4-chloroindolyl phosphate hydrolysis protein
VEQRPDKLPQLRKFLNYYLPTTLKLLQSYEKLAAQGVRGQNIDQSLTAIQNLMDKIVVAFRNQLDSLFAADSMDITAEIAVMEQMMAAEGLTGPKL